MMSLRGSLWLLEVNGLLILDACLLAMCWIFPRGRWERAGQTKGAPGSASQNWLRTEVEGLLKAWSMEELSQNSFKSFEAS